MLSRQLLFVAFGLVALGTATLLSQVQAQSVSNSVPTCAPIVKGVFATSRTDIDGDGVQEYRTYSSSYKGKIKQDPLLAIEGMKISSPGTWTDDKGNSLDLTVSIARDLPPITDNMQCGGYMTTGGESVTSPDILTIPTTSVSLSHMQKICAPPAGCGYNYALTGSVPVEVHQAPTSNNSGGNGGSGNLPAPPTLSVATSCANNKAQNVLSWNASANSPGYRIYRYGGGGTNPYARTDTESVTSYTDSNLASNIVFSYEIWTNHPGVTPTISNRVEVKTNNCAPTPSGGSSGGGGGGGSGTASAYNVAIKAENICQGNSSVNRISWSNVRYALSYDIYQNGKLIWTANEDGKANKQLITNPAIPGSTFNYQVFAKSAPTSVIAQSLTATVTATSCGSKPDNFTLTASGVCTGSKPEMRLSWTRANNADRYLIQRNDMLIATLDKATTLYTDRPDLSAGTSLEYVVKAVNTNGVFSTNVVEAQAPSCTATNSISLGAVNTYCSTAQPTNMLNWRGLGDFKNYRVLRAGQELATVQATSNKTHTYLDTKASIDTIYEYQIIGDNETQSNTRSIMTSNCNQKLDAFTLVGVMTCALNDNPRILNQSSRYVPVMAKLSWNGSKDAQSYRIRRDNLTLATMDASQQLYLDKTVSPNVSYKYSVQAINKIGARESNAITLNTKDCDSINRSPSAEDDTATTTSTSPVEIKVLNNDKDPEGKLVTQSVALTTPPVNGKAEVQENGNIRYTPENDFAGTDKFEYQVCDAEKLCDPATVAVTVTPATTQIREPGAFSLSVRQGACGSLNNVLEWSRSERATGYIVLRDGQIIGNTADLQFGDNVAASGKGLEYKYSVRATNKDGSTLSNEKQSRPSLDECVNPDRYRDIKTPIGKTPIINDDAVSMNQNNFIVIDVLGNDIDPDGKIDPTCTQIVTKPKNGGLEVNSANGQIVYTPTKDFKGTDSFGYEACDTQGLKDDATVTITVASLAPSTPAITPPVTSTTNSKKPPIANDDQATTTQGKSVEINVLANDIATQGTLNASCVAISKQAVKGNLKVESKTGRITYTPTSAFSGTDYFEYRVCDSAGLIDTAKVSITVSAAPQTQSWRDLSFLSNLTNFWGWLTSYFSTSYKN
ncbi:tandem-95 repeat protein [Candidatus Berkelbacteria bacterium]|nr:tandem-95 repeat protein [Candidatus Berkelbacteria bacterium]